jgi:hypothetical protein
MLTEREAAFADLQDGRRDADCAENRDGLRFADLFDRDNNSRNTKLTSRALDAGASRRDKNSLRLVEIVR